MCFAKLKSLRAASNLKSKATQTGWIKITTLVLLSPIMPTLARP